MTNSKCYGINHSPKNARAVSKIGSVASESDKHIDELWHSVQDAYVAGDLAQLETLLALTELMGLAEEKTPHLAL